MKAVKGILFLVTCVFAMTLSTSCSKDDNEIYSYEISFELTDQGSLSDIEAGALKQGLFEKSSTFDNTESGAISAFDAASTAFQAELKKKEPELNVTKRVVITMKLINKEKKDQLVKSKDIYINPVK